jgi:hypothetical protein
MTFHSIEILGLPMIGKWKEVQADYQKFLRDPKRLPYFRWCIQNPSQEDPMEKVRRVLDSENASMEAREK